MTPQEEYDETKVETDRLVRNFCEWSQERKGGNWYSEELPTYAPMDYKIFKDGELKFYLEVKFRRHKKGTYQEEKVPVTKYCFAYTFYREFGEKSYYLIRWEDTLGIVDLEKYGRIKEMVARHDRGEEKDMYALYETENFTELKDLYFRYITEELIKM